MSWIEKTLQQARTARWKRLDLGNAGLREIPPEVFDLDTLEFLMLGSRYYDPERNAWVESNNQGLANQITWIPGEITRLIKLTALDLSVTQVSDLMPLQGLGNLVELHLYGTQVSDLTPLQGLGNLAELHLSATQVSDLTPLQGLSNLVELHLNATQVSDLTPLQGLSSLVELHLSTTQVSDLTPLQGLGNLAKLHFYGTQVSDLTPLQSLGNLVELHLRGTQVSDLTPLQSLGNLVGLDLDGTQVSDLTPLQGLDNLASLRLDTTQVNDLTPLQGLGNLAKLHLDGTQVSDLTPLQGLGNLALLGLGNTQVSDLTPLQGLGNLASLQLHATQVSDLTPLQGLGNLALLGLRGTQVSDLTPLQGLGNLADLDLHGTQVSDLTPLQGLDNLAKLRLDGTQVNDLTPLQGLGNLASLHLYGTQVSDLTPLQGLDNLALLRLDTTQVSDLTPLQGLGNLAKLHLYGTQVSDLTPLQGLGNLAELHLSGTQVSDLTPLQGLGNLASLHLYGTQVSDLTPLQGLGNLAFLGLGTTQVSDLTPLQGLGNLAELDLRETQMSTFPDFVLELPNLHKLYLYGSPIHDVPIEILGSSEYGNCLDAMRAHFADKAYGVALDREIKLILLGNGRVGKTSIVKQLVEEDFNPCEPSTHGIHLVPWDLPDHGDAIRINVWDFGGQDIYHGTHALFLRSRALFLLVWDRDSERQPGYEADGVHFAHFPLSYWLDYIGDTSPDSPVLVIENKCDDGSASEAPVAVPGSHLAFSAKTGFGREAVTGWLRDTSRHELAQLGAREIGIGRWQVKQTLLDYMEQDEEREPADRQYRTISYAHFQQLCEAQAGHVSSARELLRYFHHTGVVYYQKELFNDQIILDQRWAIEAIYTIFHREKSYPYLKRQGGRFRPSDLHHLIWKDQFPQEEQRLFLTFMQSCALCFRLSERHEDDPEYLIPDLLPSKETLEGDLYYRRKTYGNEVLYYRYTHPFLHQGTMRRFTVHMGRMFRDQALYWKDGVFIDSPRLQAMSIIECTRGINGNPSQGRIALEVRGRQRRTLLNRMRNEFERLATRPESIEQTVSLDGGENWIDVADLEKAHQTRKVVSQQGQMLEAQDFLFLLSKEPSDDLSEDAPYPREKGVVPPSNATIYLSYAWGDAQENGSSREDIVNRLYASLIADGYDVKRDKMDLDYKGLISEFMQEIGRGDYIVVVISDKYVKSPFCMFELLEIYRHGKFHDRIFPFVLPDAKIWNAPDRLGYKKYWIGTQDNLQQAIDEAGGLYEVAEATAKEYYTYRDITYHVDNLLAFLADENSLKPQLIEANDFETLKRSIDKRLKSLP